VDGPGICWADRAVLTYIGIGFAMSHLPRPLWKKVVPDLDDVPYHPTMSWLAVDGYGFDKAYFDTRRYVDGQQRLAAYPWDGAPAYFARAVDQGIGRALWFIHGGRVAAVSPAVRRFATDRQADLWAGVGLAATFAGGCGPEDLAVLRRDARADSVEFEAHLSAGSVFASKARTYAGFVPSHSEAASWALTDMGSHAAAALADDATAGRAEAGDVPRYEHWRRTIRAYFLRASTDAVR
jgi:enediyne biosynthesis protein E2